MKATSEEKESGPLFAKRHYEYIAGVINKEMLKGNPADDNWADGFVSAVTAIAMALEADNVRFSYKFFMDRALHVPGGEK